MTDEPKQDEIQRVAQAARIFLEPRWRAWRESLGTPEPACPSSNMCRFSALFVQRVLERELGGEWLVEGGEPCGAGPGGIRAADGLWQGHYWVVDGGWCWVIDLTGDQFGLEPVRVLEDDSGYLASYSEGELGDHLRGVSWRVAQWLADWETEAATAAPAAVRPAYR